MRVHSLHSYPVKGAGGILHDASHAGLKGLTGDRRWLIVDANGVFVSQREMPRLARLNVSVEPDGIVLRADEGEPLFVPLPDGAERLAVTIWRDRVDAALASASAHAMLSHWLEQPVRLVHFDEQSGRSVSRDWVDRETPVAFADGFPLLVTSAASLDELNRRIAAEGGEPVAMERFRPNLVIEGALPFAEDGWATLRVSGLVLDLVKPCARCVVTTVDQKSGKKTGKEPLATLARTNRSADPRAPGALFGWNAVPRGPGHVHVGDEVTVLTLREAPWSIA